MKKKKQILSEIRTEIQIHEFPTHSDQRKIQELDGTITLNEEKLITLLQLRLHEIFSEENRDDLRETQIKLSMMWKNWSDFKIYESMNFEMKIDQKSRHNSWTHGQKSKTAEWN